MGSILLRRRGKVKSWLCGSELAAVYIHYTSKNWVGNGMCFSGAELLLDQLGARIRLLFPDCFVDFWSFLFDCKGLDY
jgi:hypothetical protein